MWEIHLLKLIPALIKLAAALHDPNSQSILQQLPNDTKNAALYQILTGGKGSSSGTANLDANTIAKAYAKLPVDTKTAVASYNPQADQYFENLPSWLQNQNKASDLNTQLQQLKQQRFGANGESTPAQSKFMDLVKSGLLGQAGVVGGVGAALMHFFSPYALATLPLGSIAARNMAKALTNPDLVNAYINNTQLPVTNTLTKSALKQMPAYFATPQGVNIAK